MNMKRFLPLAAAAFFTTANITIAQDIPAPASKSKFEFSGYVDAYYQYNTNSPLSDMNQGRIFDLYHNKVAMGLAQTMFAYSYGKFHAVADLTIGPNAELGNFGNEGNTKFIKQAFLTYDVTDKLSVTAGQFGTHIGYELIDAPLNFNYSLSYLFGNGPFYHTGAKLNYAINDKFGVMMGIVQGWDGIKDYNKEKSLVAQFYLAPVSGFDIYLNWIGGDEHNTASNFGELDGSYTSLFDLTTSYQVTEDFKVGINAAYGSFLTGNKETPNPAPQDPWYSDASWGGAALYLNYNTSDKFGLGLRTEYFSDPSGVRYFGPLEVTSFTLTSDIKLADSQFILKPEVRMDFANNGFFEDKAGNMGKKNQTTLGAAFIYTFGLCK